MKRRITLLAAGALIAATTLSASPAAAATVVYTVAGTFSDGKVLGGSFRYDNTLAYDSVLSYFDCNFTLDGASWAANASSYPPPSPGRGGTFTIGFLSRDDRAPIQTLRFVLNTTSTANFAQGVLQSSKLTGSYLTIDDKQVLLNAGATATASVAAVPEPATWAMMLTGFGLAGAALRRRRQGATLAVG